MKIVRQETICDTSRAPAIFNTLQDDLICLTDRPMFPDCPLVKPSEGYETDDNVLNLVTFDTEHVSDEEWRDICRRSRCYNYADRTKGEYISINRGNQEDVAEYQNEYDIPHLDDIWDYTIPQEEYEEYDSEEEEEEKESEADDCSSNASANHVTREEIHGWLRDDVYAAIKNDKLDEFIEVFNEYIDNPEIEDYFYDYGGRPASSCWEQTNYKYCVCDSEWEDVHRQLERRKCNCVNGKRWILYEMANDYEAQKIGKYIAESEGPFEAVYEVWQRVDSEAEDEEDQFYQDAYDAQYAIDELRAKQEQEEWEALRLEYEEEERRRREEEEIQADFEYWEAVEEANRPKTRGEELEEEEEMRIRDREERRWKLERWP